MDTEKNTAKTEILVCLSQAIEFCAHAMGLLDEGLGIKSEAEYKETDTELEKVLKEKIRSGSYTMEDWQQYGEVIARIDKRKAGKKMDNVSDRLFRLVEQLDQIRLEVLKIGVGNGNQGNQLGNVQG